MLKDAQGLFFHVFTSGCSCSLVNLKPTFFSPSGVTFVGGRWLNLHVSILCASLRVGQLQRDGRRTPNLRVAA